MEKNEIFKMGFLEDSNWWYSSRRELIIGLLSRGNLRKNSVVLDMGAGSGKNIATIKEMGFRTEAIDVDSHCVRLAKQKGINVKKSSIENFKFEKKYDVILALDVLEHIKDDVSAIKKIKSGMRKNGKFIITVPAFMILFGPHDTLSHHFRRYEFGEIVSKLDKSGFKIEKISFWNFSFFFPSLIVKFAKKWLYTGKEFSAKSDLANVNHLLNYLLTKILLLENFLILNGISMPIGTSLSINLLMNLAYSKDAESELLP